VKTGKIDDEQVGVEKISRVQDAVRKQLGSPACPVALSVI